jgi:hypothetical protein
MALDPAQQIQLRSIQYRIPVDWWSSGRVVYQLVSKRHKARTASSFAAILQASSFQALFDKKDDILNYVSWCSRDDRTSK